jgi:hypothetical protein
MAERVKVWWIDAEEPVEPVVPTARLLDKSMMHADLAALAGRMFDSAPERTRDDLLAPFFASTSEASTITRD